MSKKLFTVALASFVMFATARTIRGGEKNKQQSLRVVPSVDLSRYAGRWYEAARLPNRFQDGRGKECVGVAAT